MTDTKKGAAARAAAPARSPKAEAMLRRSLLLLKAAALVPEEGWDDVHELFLWETASRTTRIHLSREETATALAMAACEGATAAMENGELVVRHPDGSTWVYVPAGQKPIRWWAHPYGCAWCGGQQGRHGRAWSDFLGDGHWWERPTDEVIKVRMKARRKRNGR
ncbi:hypothetical protein AB0A05_27225 [Streptomyces sp. NPDC046374]|uniref:hypothetical protein n=1 Tax=Streptomyces sp. NPDC046374 TaxID=3154917 RepID=UPI0033E66D5B